MIIFEREVCFWLVFISAIEYHNEIMMGFILRFKGVALAVENFSSSALKILTTVIYHFNFAQLSDSSFMKQPRLPFFPSHPSNLFS